MLFSSGARDVVRHGLGAPEQKYSPHNEMKPIIPSGLGFMFFDRFVFQKLINFIIFD